MKRYRQTLDEIVASLSVVETSWMDEHSAAVIQAIQSIPQKESYGREDIAIVFDADFDAAMTTVRLALEMSKDEFRIALRQALAEGGAGITRYRRDRDEFLSAIESLGTIGAIVNLANRPVGWRDILVERLKLGRGSAIKGQKRGRFLEDFAEEAIRRVFAGVGYDTRCRFVGATGTSTEKTDFAIPSKEDARILIERRFPQPLID